MLKAGIPHLDGELKQPLFKRRAFIECRPDRRVHAIINPRHRYQHCRTHGLQVFGELLHRARIGYDRSRHHRQIISARALERMRKWQKRQKHILRFDRHHAQTSVRVREQIAMTQHHALGATGSAGRIDNRGQRKRVMRHVPRRVDA